MAKVEEPTVKSEISLQLLQVGTTAPPWQLRKTRELKDYKEKVVVMDFWATWCKPCVESFPMLMNIHKIYKDVAVLGMNYKDNKFLI